MTRRKLTEEEIDRIARKEWKKPKKITVVRDTDDPEKFAVRINNLTGPKTIEGKKKVLSNLIMGKKEGTPSKSTHGGYIRRILNEEEQQFFDMRKEQYLKDYDINESADEVLLNLVLMDELIIFRMLSRQADKPSLDISRPLTDAQNRLSKNLDNLGMLRKQRLNQEKRNNTEITIAKLAEMVARDRAKIQEELEQARKEEEEYLRSLKQRRAENIIDAELTEEVDEQ